MPFRNKWTKIILALALVISVVIPAGLTANPVNAATITPFNLVFYGTHTSSIDQRIVNANPMFLIDNTPKGPWHGNCNTSYFASYGIKVFSYIDGGYEGTQGRAIPNDLQSNLNYIDAIATEAGVYGIFLDEVSSYPSSAGISYLSQIYNRAKQRGLAVMFNTGVNSWSDTLMQYCDYMNSSEVYSGASMTATQQKWASRTVLLTQGVSSANTAAGLTNTAISLGFLAHYASVSYMSLPDYLEPYVSLVGGVSPPPATNYAPVLAAIGNKTVTVGNSLQFTVSASDSDGDTLSYSASGLPAGASFNTSTRVFSWTPTSNSVYTATFRVSDGALSDSETVTITVLSATEPPVTGVGNTTGTVAGVASPSGGANEYNLYLSVISSTVSGVTPGQQVWLAATTTDYPNLLTVGAKLSGNLDRSLGWWVLKAVK